MNVIGRDNNVKKAFPAYPEFTEGLLGRLGQLSRKLIPLGGLGKAGAVQQTQQHTPGKFHLLQTFLQSRHTPAQKLLRRAGNMLAAKTGQQL